MLFFLYFTLWKSHCWSEVYKFCFSLNRSYINSKPCTIITVFVIVSKISFMVSRCIYDISVSNRAYLAAVPNWVSSSKRSLKNVFRLILHKYLIFSEICLHKFRCKFVEPEDSSFLECYAIYTYCLTENTIIASLALGSFPCHKEPQLFFFTPHCRKLEDSVLGCYSVL